MAENSTNSTVTWEVNADGSRVRREKKFYLVSYDSYVQKDYHKGILYFRLVKSLREATALSMAEVEEHRRAVSNHSNDLLLSNRGLEILLGYGVIDPNECYNYSDFLLTTVETKTIIPVSNYVVGIDMGILWHTNATDSKKVT